jgi:hypothetical protein
MARFRNRLDGMNRRKPLWICLSCGTEYKEKKRQCLLCDKPLQYFASTGEAKRYRELRLEQECGLISGLTVQPKFPVEINGILICTYKGDYGYLRDGVQVYEDVKGKGKDSLTREFKLKKKLVEAVYGVSITVVHR